MAEPSYGPYRLVRPLGTGGQGQVYLAHDDRTDQAVALKLVKFAPARQGDNGQRGRFLAEAYALRKLVHPNIATVIAAGEHDEGGWLAMQLAPGVSLERYVRPAWLLPEALVYAAGAAISRALAYAHGMGIVHRDVKPSNVIVHWPSNSIMLTDFGLARSSDSETTRTGVVLGSPEYLAPEQLAGALPEPRTDLYALGVLLFEMLTGRRPFAAATMGELLRAVAQAPAPDILSLAPSLPIEAAELIAQLLQKAATARPASAMAVAERLEALAAAAVPSSRR